MEHVIKQRICISKGSRSRSSLKGEGREAAAPDSDSGPHTQEGGAVQDTGAGASPSVLRAPLLWLRRPQRLPRGRPAGLVDVRVQPVTESSRPHLRSWGPGVAPHQRVTRACWHGGPHARTALTDVFTGSRVVDPASLSLRRAAAPKQPGRAPSVSVFRISGCERSRSCRLVTSRAE